MNLEYVLSFGNDIFAAQYYVHSGVSHSIVSNYYHCIYGAAYKSKHTVMWMVFGKPKRTYNVYSIYYDSDNTTSFHLQNDTGDGYFKIKTKFGTIVEVGIYDTITHICSKCIKLRGDNVYIDDHGIPGNIPTRNTIALLYKRLGHLF